jgi:hypothetical protein
MHPQPAPAGEPQRETFADWCVKVDELLEPHDCDAAMLTTMDDVREEFAEGVTAEEFANALLIEKAVQLTPTPAGEAVAKLQQDKG